MADNELLPVTQADREAAAKAGRPDPRYSRDVLAGERDSNWLVQAFARHRLATTDNAELVGALTPSAETKAAYIGEVRDSITITDGCGAERTIRHDVSWTAVKEIMAMIRAYALARTEQQP